MVAPDLDNAVHDQIRTSHSVHGLSSVARHIAGQNAEGKSVFLSTDSHGHHRELFNESAISNVIYPTKQHTVQINGGVETKYAYAKEPGTTIENGSVCRMIDFAPGGVSPMQRINGLEYAVIMEGVFRMILDSGEERILQRGDIAVQKSTAHEWVNVTGNGLLPARILLVQLDDIQRDGEKVQRELGVRRTDYVSARGTNFYGDDFFESEF